MDPANRPRGNDQSCLNHLHRTRASRQYESNLDDLVWALGNSGLCLIRSETHSADGSTGRSMRLSLSPAHNLSCDRGVLFAVRRVNTAYRNSLTVNLPGVRTSWFGILHRSSSDPSGIPHSRQRPLATERSVRLLPEISPRAANPRRHPTHTPDGVRRESASTRSARDTDLLATLLLLPWRTTEAARVSIRPNAVTLGGGRLSG